MIKQKKLTSGARFGLALASFLLGILLFVSVTVTALIADVRIVTSKENISGFVRELISAPAHVRPKAPMASGEGGLRLPPRVSRTYQMPRREEPAGVADRLTDQLIGMFYGELIDQFSEAMPITQDEFTKLIYESTVKDYIADKTAALITDYFNNEITTTFEPEEIVQLIDENAELIETIVGEPLPADIAQQVAAVFDQNEIIVKVEAEGLAGFMELTGGSSSGSGDALATKGNDQVTGILNAIASGDFNSINISDIVALLRSFSSLGHLIWSIVICLVLIAAIILVNIRQLPKGLRRAGYPLLLAGLGIILNLLAQFVPKMWEGSLGLIIVRYILLQTAVVNIVVFCLGLALVIAGIVLGIVLRKKRALPVTVPASPEAGELAVAPAEETPVEISCESAEEDPAEEACEEGPIAEETAPVGE